MRRKAVDFLEFSEPQGLATEIANKYHSWETKRASWLELTKEARDYIFATDTRSTTSGSLGWKNSTHIPKLCQIRDNLHANYMAALFPNDRAITFEARNRESAVAKSKEAIEAYMRNKLRLSDFRSEVKKCLSDFVDYGNCFAQVDFVNETVTDPYTGETTTKYAGPQFSRISPLDIVFDPTATDFTRTPKIKRSLSSLSDLAVMLEDYPEMGYLQEIFNQVIDLRDKFRTAGVGTGMDVKKNAAFLADGFGSFRDYFESDYVELLEFYGDIWDHEQGTLHRNQHIVVVDRAYIIRQESHPNWFGHPPIFHAGWRDRPDNLYAMGPLDNLVGLQYRIDHLENAKADAADMILHPVLKIKGFVEDFDYGPGARIYTGEEGDVTFMNPDASFLSLNTEIASIMQLMEEMAGAPRQAMGLRTPGEKTKFEVQVLENGANRVFINKTSHFEVVFLEPALNAMLETARRNFGLAESVRVEDSDFNFIKFINITKQDLLSSGNIRAIGARRFANKANILQELVQLGNSSLGQDPEVMSHFSSVKIAKMLEDLMELKEYGLVQKNIRISERADAERAIQSAQQMVAEEQQAGLPTEMQQGQPPVPPQGGPEQ